MHRNKRFLPSSKKPLSNNRRVPSSSKTPFPQALPQRAKHPTRSHPRQPQPLEPAPWPVAAPLHAEPKQCAALSYGSSSYSSRNLPSHTHRGRLHKETAPWFPAPAGSWAKANRSPTPHSMRQAAKSAVGDGGTRQVQKKGELRDTPSYRLNHDKASRERNRPENCKFL